MFRLLWIQLLSSENLQSRQAIKAAALKLLKKAVSSRRISRQTAILLLQGGNLRESNLIYCCFSLNSSRSLTREAVATIENLDLPPISTQTEELPSFIENTSKMIIFLIQKTILQLPKLPPSQLLFLQFKSLQYFLKQTKQFHFLVPLSVQQPLLA